MAPRLDTLLSRALLDAGSLDSSILEEAVQDQVIHGGALDTLLLERGAVAERVLAALLAQAWGTEPVPLTAFQAPGPEAVRALPERMALAMKLCPYAIEDKAVHVLCPAPLDRALIEEVSALLGKPLVPHVVPEVRLWQAMQRAYGTPPDERFAALLTDLDGSPAAGSHSRAAPIGDDDEILQVAAGWDLIEALAQLATQTSRDGIARVAVSFARKLLPFAAMIGVRGGPEGAGSTMGIGWLRSGPTEGGGFLNTPFRIPHDCILDGALQSSAPSIGRPAISAGNAALFGWLGRRRPRTFLVMPIVVATRPVGALLADGGIRARDFVSLSELVSFGARLGPAFEVLLRQRHQQHPSLFPQPAQEPPEVEPPARYGGQGSPRPITMPTMARTDLPQLRDGTSPFARNYIVPRAEPLNPLSQSASLAEAPTPTASEQRARVVGDDDEEGWEDIHYDGDGFIPSANPFSMPSPMLLPTSLALAPFENYRDPALDADGSLPQPTLDTAQLVDQLDAVDDDTAARAKHALIERGAAVVPALCARFPGRLRVDPFDAGEVIHQPHRLGPLVEVLYALGPAGLDAAAPHLDSRNPAHRFVAVLLFALIPDARSIELLRARLHDQEPSIRRLAAAALSPFIAHPRFEAVLLHLRERLHSPQHEARRRAVQLLGSFRDVGAVPLLIALLNGARNGKPLPVLAEDVRQALRSITLQDFGVRARGWDKWWQKAKKRSRVDWLLEGLASEDREIRVLAHVELASMAGDDFGFRPDDDRKNRQRAATAFYSWWDQQQKRPRAG